MAKQLKDVLESFEFNRAALAKQRLANLRRMGHKTRGARIANLMRAAGLKEEEMDEQDLDQLDEVLSKDASAEEWIHDFVHSDAPQFQGKTKKERIKMALAAKYAKANEETELEESRYGRSSSYQRDYDSSRTGFGRREREDDEYHVPDPYIPPARPAPAKPPAKPEQKKVTKEEVEQIDEKSEQARRNKIMKNVMDASKGAQFNRTSGLNIQPGDTGHQTKQQMNKALGRALRKEESEMNEAKDTVVKDKSGKVVSFKHEGDWKKTPAQHKDQFGNVIKDKNVARNLARQGMQQAMKEEHGIDISDEDADTIVEGVLGALAGGTLAALATGPVGALAGAYLGHKVQQGANAKKKLADKQQKEEVELEEDKYAGLEAEDKKGLPTAMIKKSKKAVEGDTVEGWDHPHNAVKKESYDEEGNLITMPKTYAEFMEGMTATKVAPGVTRYTGGSYGNAKGAKYGNTDYDKETLDTKDDEGGEESQKRGRGRPAGSKSGARGPRIK